MATVEHSTLGAGETHEPKNYQLTVRLADVSTASTVYVPIPFAGTITKVTSVLAGAITTGDATVTVSDSSASSMGTLTITQSGSAAGDVDTLSPSTNNTVTDNDYITIATDGASGTTRELVLVVSVQRS